MRKQANKPFVIGITEDERQFNEKSLAKSTVEVFGKVDIEKSIINLLNGPEGSIERLAFEVDPLNQHTYAGVYRPITRLVPNVVKKRIATQDSLVANIVRARQNHMSTFGKPRPDRYSLGFIIEPFPGVLDRMSDEEKENFSKQSDRAIGLINTCGDTEGRKSNEIKSFAEWLSLSVRDAEVVGYVATEIVYKTDIVSNEKVFHYFAHTDAGTIYQATKDSEAAQQSVREDAYNLLARVIGKENLIKEKFKNNEYDWVQVIDGTPRQMFTDKELKVANFYPVGNVELEGYPVTPIDTVISAITTHLSITTHNRLYFQSGRATRGMLIIQSDDVNPTVVHNIKQQFNACVAGKTKIITKEFGETSIDQLLSGAERKAVTIWTGRDWQKAEVYLTGHKKLVRTRLANGADLSTSPDHRFLTVGTNGLVWKEQKDLVVGDFVCVNKKEIEDPSFVPEYNGTPVTEGLMEVLGWLTGDGTMSVRGDYRRNTNHFQLYYHHTKEPKILDRHLAVLNDFGVKATKYERAVSSRESEYLKDRYGFKSTAPVRIGISSYDANFVDWLISLGFSSSKVGKILPAFLYKLPTGLKSAFLRGFFSADGNNSARKDPSITISSDSLREQTRSLLTTLGIRTTSYQGMSGGRFGTERKACRLLIKDRKRFFDYIGFLQDHKQPKADFDAGSRGRSDQIPHGALVALASQVLEFDSKDRLLSKTRRDRLMGIISGERGASRKYLLDIMAEAGFTPPKWLLQYNFEPVVEKIDMGRSVVMYDATVHDEEHTFMADGVVTHNSINGADRAWRLPVFSVPTDSEITWQPIDTSGSRDMEFQYLTDLNAREILTAFMMSPDELPGWSYLSRGTNSQALSESKGEFQLEAGRDVGLRPLLQTFEAFINKEIFPLIDSELAKMARVTFAGLDADSPEKEIVGLQQKSQVYMTMNDIQKVVEKPLIPKRWCSEIPLNPVFKSYLDQYCTVGQIMEHFMGIEGASKDPRWDYVRDPLYFQNMQLQMSAQQMQMQAQAQQQQPQQEQPSEGEPHDLSSGVNQGLEMMAKSEGSFRIPTNKKKLLQQQERAMKWLQDGFEEDIGLATKEILAEVKKVSPR